MTNYLFINYLSNVILSYFASFQISLRMVNYSFNVVDELGRIRGVAMVDTKDVSKVRLVPNVEVLASTSTISSTISSSVQVVESLPATPGLPPVSSSLENDLELSSDSSDSDHDQLLLRKKKEAEIRPSRSPIRTGSSKTRRRRRNSSSSTSSSASSNSASSVKRRRRVLPSSPVSGKEKRSALKTVETRQEDSVENSPLPSPVAASTPIIPSQSAAVAISPQNPGVKKTKRVATPGSSKEPEGEFNVDNYIDNLDQNRNAKLKLSAEKFSRFSQPFSHGWKRECVVGSRGIATVVYVSPSNRRCVNNQQIQKSLEESPETGLTLESFDFGKIFFGFSKDQEKIIKSSFYTNVITEDPTAQQPTWGKMVLINGKQKGVKCIHPSCNKGISKSIPVHNSHVKRAHTAPVPCPQCGMLITATYLEKHLNSKHDGNKYLNEKKTKNTKPSGNENNNKNNQKSKVSGESNSNPRKTSKDPKRIKDPVPGPSRSGNSENNTNMITPNKEVKKEKISEENPAVQIAHRIKTEPRDHSVNSPLNTGQKARVTFIIKQNDGKEERIIGVKIEKGKKLNQIRKLMRKWEQEAGLDPTKAVWVCEGKPLNGEETADSLNGKRIFLIQRCF